MEYVYGGSIFNMVLWLYWLTGATSLFMGVFHILRGEVQRHRSWMSVNYGTTLGAGFLRLFWACFAVACPQYKMDQINAAATLMFIPAMLCFAAGYSSYAHRKHYDYAGMQANTLRAALVIFALVSAALLSNQNLLRFGPFSSVGPTADLNTVFGATEKVKEQHALLFRTGAPDSDLPSDEFGEQTRIPWQHTASAMAHVSS